MAIKLNGGSLHLVKNTPFGGTTPQSFDFWIYFDTVPNNATLIIHNNNSGADHDKEIFIVNKKLKLYVYSGGAVNLLGTNPILEKEWNHIAYVFDGKSVKLYLNGILDMQANLTNTHYYPSVNMRSTNMNASYDDIRYWTKALTQEDIQDIVRGIKISNEGLQHHYKYDGTTGNKIIDLTGNGNSITISGGSSWVEGTRLADLKFIMQNISNNKYYTCISNELIELQDASNETIKTQGIEDGVVLNIDSISDFRNLLGTRFKLISYCSLNDAIPYLEKKVTHPERKLATSPDVLLLGVETINNIVANSSSSPLTAISFDNGLSWLSYENNSWVTVENAHQGMSVTTLNSIPADTLTQIKGDSNYIKFQHSFGNYDEISSFKMYVDFKGTNGILDTAYYSFDYSGGQLEVTLKKQGNYSIVYTDVEA